MELPIVIHNTPDNNNSSTSSKIYDTGGTHVRVPPQSRVLPIINQNQNQSLVSLLLFHKPIS